MGALFRLWLPGKPPASGNIVQVVRGRAAPGRKTPLIPLRSGAIWRQAVRDLATLTCRQAGWARVEAGPVAVRVIVTRPPRKAPQPDRPTSTPDVENHLKGLLDALNGVVYRDDAQVAWLLAEKIWMEPEGMALIVLPGAPNGEAPKILTTAAEDAAGQAYDEWVTARRGRR
jgi:Holliday junction resolvase RusA-like endonuclease